MQTRITIEEMQAAARQLATTERGRVAMERLSALIESKDLDLGFLDQRAFLALLGAAWSGQGDKARELMRAALTDSPGD